MKLELNLMTNLMPSLEIRWLQMIHSSLNKLKEKEHLLTPTKSMLVLQTPVWLLLMPMLLMLKLQNKQRNKDWFSNKKKLLKKRKR